MVDDIYQIENNSTTKEHVILHTLEKRLQNMSLIGVEQGVWPGV